MQDEQEKSGDQEPDARVKRDILWQNVLVFIYLHMSAVYGLFLIFHEAHFSTIAFTFLLITWSTLSVTLGCHRLWTHRAYEGNFFIRIFFIVGHTIACQGSVYDWILEHRIHHKYHETELDPFNPKRGFVYSQLTCRILSKHPTFEKIKRDIDMTDVEADSLVMWQKTLYWFIMPVFGIFLPINIPVDYLGEELLVSLFVAGFFRLAVTLHYAWMINNATIVWGLDPLDRRSADTNLIFVVNKSLWPLYHYIIPWDYQVGEYGNYGDGFCNAILRVLAALGWVNNLRTVDTAGIRRALHQSAKLNKPISECIQENEVQPTFLDVVSSQNRPCR